MRRLLIILALLIGVLAPAVALPRTSMAFDPVSTVCEGEASSSEVCNRNNENPIAGKDGVLVTVIRILSFVAGVATVLMVILGGLKYVLANGDSKSIQSAKNTILYAIIGAVVFLFSQAIIRFVIGRL